MRAELRNRVVGAGAGRGPGLRVAVRCGALLAVAALAVPLGSQAAYAVGDAAPGGAPAVSLSPGDNPLAGAEATLGPLLTTIHTLYQNAEAATEQYNATAARLASQQSDLAALNGKLAAQQQVVDTGMDVAAELAADQYQNDGLSAFGELLLAKDPYQAVQLGALLSAAGRSQAAFIGQLKAAQASLQQLQKQSQAALAGSQALLDQQNQNKTAIAQQLAGVEQVVSSLTGAQQSELEQLEQQQVDQAQLAFLASGALGRGERTPSAAGRQAVAYALAQLGKPYVWGAIGPDSFDCSGLTSQAWLHAGVTIPRTSQDQWADLTHVPLNQLRPGDLVIYYADADHVAMYIGGGLVVQAPHTGAVVRVSPIGMAPILGAVRPDPQDGADDRGGAWTVPAGLAQAADAPTPIAPGNTPGLPTVTPPPAAPPAAQQPKPQPGGPAGPAPSGASPAPSGPAPAPPSPSATPTASPGAGASGGPTPSGPASASPSGSSSPSASGSPSPEGR
ncbi:NlpC/P60 family protein [Kitasatospora sp. NPDC052896]|uniref:C40 family peptidase n=1 Tax=Kitasatospora sp. NPDC052896 TaxID=3364061 RepID=UPI0037CA0495